MTNTNRRVAEVDYADQTQLEIRIDVYKRQEFYQFHDDIHSVQAQRTCYATIRRYDRQSS